MVVVDWKLKSVGVNQVCHRVESFLLEPRNVVAGKSGSTDFFADHNFYFSRINIGLSGRHELSGSNNDHGKNRLLRIDRDSERPIMKRLKDFARSVLRSFWKD